MKAKKFKTTIKKFNPYHDSKGRFTSRGGHSSFSPGKDPQQAQRSVDRENAKRKQDGMDAEDQVVGGAYYNVQKMPYGTLLNKYLADKAAKEEPIKQTAPPEKAGKGVKWNNMTDQEFVNDLEKYMPGVNDIIRKGWMETEMAQSFTPGGYYSSGKAVNTALNGDMLLTDIYTARGYNGKPQMMDKADIKTYISNNNTPELYRGMGNSRNGQKGSDKQTRFAEDKLHFAGLGVLGNGTYAAETPKGTNYTNTGLRVARNYAKTGGGDLTGSCVRMTLDKKTKTAAYSSVLGQKKDFQNKLAEANRNGAIDNDTYKRISLLTSDVGRFGALRGYEAWYDKTDSNKYSGARARNPYWVVTDRSKIIIQNERYDA